MDERYLTTEQVANILQVHPFTILKFIKEGKLKGIKLGRVYRLKESDVEKFLEERMIKPISEPKEHKEKPILDETHYKINSRGSNEKDGGHYYII